MYVLYLWPYIILYHLIDMHLYMTLTWDCTSFFIIYINIDLYLT